MAALKRPNNSYYYYLVDESIKKNQASDRFRAFVCQKIGARAEIEMRYIRELQDWINNLQLSNYSKLPSDRYMTGDVMETLLSMMRTEATSAVESRQKLYNRTMAEDGPYARLQNLKDEILEQGCLEEKEETFSELFAKRNETAKAYNKHKEAKEHYGHQIEALEGQLLHRSRLTSARIKLRSGTKKIDEMRERLSRLRRQHEIEDGKVDSLQQQLTDMEFSTKANLQKMEQQLKKLEIRRITLISAEIQRYIECLDNRYASLKFNIFGKPETRGYAAIEGPLKMHWLNVEQNAELGGRPSFQQLFEAPSAKQQAQQMALRSKSGNKDRQAPATTSTLSSFMTSNSASSSKEETLGDDLHESASAFITKISRMTTLTNTTPNQKKSEESIECLDLPPETRCQANLTEIEPNKQYTSRMKLARLNRDDDEQPIRAQITGIQIQQISQDQEPLGMGRTHSEYVDVNKFVPEESESDEYDSDESVGNLQNVRVIAVADNYPISGSNELAFVKGQIIKQKMNANSDGLCYGWLRENILSQKQYGYYSKRKVKLYRKERKQMS